MERPRRPQNSQQTQTLLRQRQLNQLMAVGCVLVTLIGMWIQEQQMPNPVILDNWGEVQSQAYTEDKLCLVYLYAPFCYACDLAEERLFRHPALARQLQDAYISYRVDGTNIAKGRVLSEKYNIASFPAILLTDADGKFIKKLSPGISDERLLKELQQAALLRNRPINPELRKPAMVDGEGNQPGIFRSIGQSDRTYGLVVDNRHTWVAAAMQADQEKQKWNKGVWVQPNPRKGYDIIIGPFISKGEAQKTSQFMENWEKRPSDVVRMRPRQIKP